MMIHRISYNEYEIRSQKDTFFTLIIYHRCKNPIPLLMDSITLFHIVGNEPCIIPEFLLLVVIMTDRSEK